MDKELSITQTKLLGECKEDDTLGDYRLLDCSEEGNLMHSTYYSRDNCTGIPMVYAFKNMLRFVFLSRMHLFLVMDVIIMTGKRRYVRTWMTG